MISKMLFLGMLLSIVLARAVYSADIALELVMPGNMFWPGSPCRLDLHANNTGAAMTGAELYVVLTLGTGDSWYYPSWRLYPPIDFEVIYPAGHTEAVLRILPEFSWPEGCGEFYGAMFYAAVMHGGNLVSNLANYTFGWSESQRPTPGAWYSTDAIAGNMRMIPWGGLIQGSPGEEPCRNSDESLFTHFLTHNIAVMETEVTRQMWADLRSLQPSLPIDPSRTEFSPSMEHPVQTITWYESILFANLLSLQNGLARCYFEDADFTIPLDSTNYLTAPVCCNFTSNGYRLPAEGEWEYFCRAGTATPFSCNEPNFTSVNCGLCFAGIHPILERYCVYCANAAGKTEAVGSKLQNPWNLKDVHGNVMEWCWDWYDTYPGSPQINYTGSATGSTRVMRGGGWDVNAGFGRSAYRYADEPDGSTFNLGFRLIRTAP